MRAFVVMAVGLLTAVLSCAQPGEGPTSHAQEQRQTFSPAPPAAAPILEIYNFALAGGAESSEQARVLQQAVPDSLYLRFLGNARIEVRRIRQPYTSSASRSGSRLDETTPHYVLDGKIAFMQGGAALSAQGASQSASNFVLITYSLHDVGGEKSSKAAVEKDETSTFAQLPQTLRRISGQVMTAILPPLKITVQVNAPQFKDFPATRQPFYTQNLPELLKGRVSRQSWIEVIEANGPANYEINETLRADKDKSGYELQAVISRGGVPIGNALTEPAREMEVLAAQTRLADEIIDALKVNAALAPALQAATTQPSSEDYYTSAQAYEKTDPDLAIALYKRAVARDPSNTDAKLSLAFTYINKNQTDEALKIVSGTEFDNSAYGQYVRSVAYTYADNQEAALKAINRAVELAPTQDACYYWRGYIYDRGEDYAKAVQDYEAAAKLNPSNADYYESAARALEKLGKYDDAIAILETGRGHTSEGPRLTTLVNDTQRRAAAHYIDSGKPVEAMRYAQASVKDDANSEWGQRLVGIAYHGLGKLPEAAKSLERALAVQPTVESYAELAQVRLEQGNKKEAFALAEKGIELDASATSPYGVLEKGIKGPEDAKEVINWLKRYAAENPPAHNALVDWDYFQLFYRPKDAEEVAALYSAYESATKSVPYSDWLDGWSNFVELCLIQGKYRQASTIAGEIVKVTPKLDYQIQIPMLFYQWIGQLLDGDCVAARNSLRELADFVARPEVDGFQSGWTFEGTRAYLDGQVARGALDAESYGVIQNAMSLLESRPLKQAKADAFRTKIRSIKNLACPSRASSLP